MNRKKDCNFVAKISRPCNACVIKEKYITRMRGVVLLSVSALNLLGWFDAAINHHFGQNIAALRSVLLYQLIGR
jgi:hypothetical protein